MPSTRKQLKVRHAEQIRAEVNKTRSQVSDKTAEGRQIIFAHIQKLSRKVQVRSRIAWAWHHTNAK